jgi:hypothetical protein
LVDAIWVPLSKPVKSAFRTFRRINWEEGKQEKMAIQQQITYSTSILIANTLELAVLTLAKVHACLVARMWCNVVGSRISLPDVHLIAAGAFAFDIALEFAVSLEFLLWIL